MARNADSVVIELEAKLDKFIADVRSGEVQFNSSMDKIKAGAGGAEHVVVTAHNKMAGSSGNTRVAMQELEHVARAASTSLASGAPVMQVLAQEAGRLGQAAGFMGGALGAVGEFMSGPWGIAVTVAATALAGLVSHLIKSGDTTEDLIAKLQKHHDQTMASEKADMAWSRTMDGLADSLKKVNAELDKRLTTEAQVEQASLRARQRDVARAQALLAGNKNPGMQAGLEANLTDANVALFKEQQITAEALGAAMGDLNIQAKNYNDALAVQLRTVTRMHPELQGQAAAMEAVNTALGKSASAAATQGLSLETTTRATDRLHSDLLRGKITVSDYTTAVQKMAVALQATADAAAKAKHAGAGNVVSDFKASIIGAEGQGKNAMGSSAAGYGQFMPSTWNHYYQQAYGGSDPSGSQRGNLAVAKGVIDVATDDYEKILKAAGQQITKASLYTMHMLSAGDPNGTVALRLLRAPEGASARSIVGNAAANVNGTIFTGTAGSARAQIAKRIGDASSATSAGVEAMASEEERQRKAAEVAAHKVEEQDAAFAREKLKLDNQLLAASAGRVESVEQSFRLERDAIIAKGEETNEAYKQAEIDGRIGEGKAQLLIQINDDVTEAKLAASKAEQARQLSERARDLMINQQGELIKELQFEEANTKTGAERREVALKLLQAEQDLLRMTLQRVIDTQPEGSEAYKNAAFALGNMPADKARKRDAINKDPNNMSPGGKYVADLTQTAGQINESLQTVAVDGLKNLQEGLLGAIKGTQSLADAFRNMADQIVSELLRIAIQQLIIKPMAELLFGGEAGGGGGGLFGGLSKIFGGGGGGTDWGALFDGQGAMSLTGMATGGAVRGGTPYMVGESGRELFVPNSNGTIIPNTDLARLGGAAGGNAQVVVRVVRGEMFDAHVERVSGPVAAQVVAASVPTITDLGAAKTVGKLGRPHM